MDETRINEAVEAAKSKFETIIREQIERAEKIKANNTWTDFSTLSPIIIGICPGDGIGPEIGKQAANIMQYMLEDEIKSGKVEIRNIDGLTIENRAKHNKAIPDDVLAEIKSCHVILKGPTTTPAAGDPWPNIESANVAMRRELDLFANVRPVRIPKDNINWCFFRENTEGAYMLGSKGFNVTDDVSMDFCVATAEGTDRIVRMAFEYAKKNGMKKVTAVTKANVVKTTDGRFSNKTKEIAKEYAADGITSDEWFIDIMTAKLLDPARRSSYQVMVLPNLYGDILTDEAAQIQGGVGTAGSANIGKRWSMFEAIHGSAPRMVTEGRAQYADPSSMIKAAAMLVGHIGFTEQSKHLEMALDICSQFEKKIQMTGRDNGATGAEYAKYILGWYDNPELEASWKEMSSKA